jgi:CRP-like cAMP-binding protein
MQVIAEPRAGSENLLSQLLREPSLHAHRIQVPAKAVVYQPDDAAINIHYIHLGQVRTFQVGPNGSRRLVEILGPDQWCGAGALARLSHYGEIAEAIGPTTISIIPVERLLGMLAQQPQLAIELIRQLAEKLAAFREDAAGLVFEDCHHRLIRTLLGLSESPAASQTEDGVVVHITHQQLAQKVGVARETVSLALAQLRRQNLLRTGRNQLSFHPGRLRANGNGSADPIAGAAAVAG